MLVIALGTYLHNPGRFPPLKIFNHTLRESFSTHGSIHRFLR